MSCVCSLTSELKVPEDQHLACWNPPEGVFTEHERTALLRHCPIVRQWRKVSVQGFNFLVYNSKRNYDSSTAWIDGPSPYLVRIQCIWEVAPCCLEDCSDALIIGYIRFNTTRTNDVPGGLTCQLPARSAQTREYVGASKIIPQVVTLIPMIKTKPVTTAEQEAAEKEMLRGPFICIDVERKTYQ